MHKQTNKTNIAYQPLAAKMRPTTLENYQGQAHLLAVGKPLYESIVAGRLHSMVLWGPAGSGKTSLASLLAHYCDAQFKQLSAVLSGVKEIKSILDEAVFYRHQSRRETVLFIDEVHRFNKAQQDVFLPFIEDGSIIFVGATTENPSFELNTALLSRCQVYRLLPLQEQDITRLIRQCFVEQESYQKYQSAFSDKQISRLASLSNGDARRALNLLETLVHFLEQSQQQQVDDELIDQVLADQGILFDKQGDTFYDLISALHKSVRGSDPDASLYWLARMLVGGCDPLYIARRTVRIASEDIGNADPRALQLALNAWQVQERLGSPEGELAIAQAISYLACAPKSNALYQGFKQAMFDAKHKPAYQVPMHLRNAPTQLMKNQGFGDEYRYAHDEPGAFAAGEVYLPESLQAAGYYCPTDRGLEKKISEKLAHLKSLNQHSDIKRYES